MAKQAKGLFDGFEFVKELPRALRTQAVGGDPVETRRRKMLEAIEQQRRFWKDPAALNGYEGKRKPMLWFKRQGTDVYLSPRYGVRPLEIEPNMPIVKLNMEHVERFLDALRQAVESGQLDERLAVLAERTTEGFHKP